MPILWRSSDFSSSVKDDVWAERVSAVKNSTQNKISFFIIILLSRLAARNPTNLVKYIKDEFPQIAASHFDL